MDGVIPSQLDNDTVIALRNKLITPIDVTYSQLKTLIDGSDLIPGALYKITDYKTIHWIVKSYNVDPAYSIVGDEAPAPIDVTITPDAVGNNPVTYYYKAYYTGSDGSHDTISLGSLEMNYIIGDATTEIEVVFGQLPSWAIEVIILRGTESGIYTEVKALVSSYNIFWF
jgi:hypothetical protein